MEYCYKKLSTVGRGPLRYLHFRGFFSLLAFVSGFSQYPGISEAAMGGAGSAQRPGLPKKTGVRCARARTRGQNSLVTGSKINK
jgi:hypothetical protein